MLSEIKREKQRELAKNKEKFLCWCERTLAPFGIHSRPKRSHVKTKDERAIGLLKETLHTLRYYKHDYSLVKDIEKLLMEE